jgi:hypothetical protein
MYADHSHSAVWPGSSNHYSEIISTPRYEDFEISYLNKNPWAHIGMGYAQCNVEYPNSDVCPYLSLENIDPKWLKAIGYGGPALEVEKIREAKARPAVKRTANDAGLEDQSSLMET